MKVRRAIGIALLPSVAIAIVAALAARSHWGVSLRRVEPAAKAPAHAPFSAAAVTAGTSSPKHSGVAARIEQLCSTCHLLPPPDVEPKRLWPEKIREMYEYAQGPRPVPPDRLPPIDEVIEYWTARAPEYLPLPADAMGSPRSPRTFRRRAIALGVIPPLPSVSSVHFVQLRDGQMPSQLLISDMRHGVVVLWTPSRTAEPARVVGRVPHPSRTHVVDLDGDGLRDILVANLGEYWPVDTTKGSVVWLRNRGREQFEPRVLIDGLGRVNDVQAGDFDSDGDLDLVVGVFGNLTSGHILYLENLTEDYDEPYFDPLPVDHHTGTSDVPILDLDRDGHLDFIALQSQESEHVIAFLNQGEGTFRPKTIYKAPHPRWGSTGIRLIDLDGDGDTDVLLNHGDSVQIPPIPRPYHGFGWLENQGSFPFTYHRLTHLPGAHTSMPADLDGDGDLDLVSSVFIPTFDPAWPNAEMLDTVIWLEHTSRGRYKRYALETGTPFHPCGDLGDYDGDGDIDIVLGNFCMFPSSSFPWQACITVFENRSQNDPEATSRGLPGPHRAVR